MSDSDQEFIAEEGSEEGPALVKKLREKLKKAIEEKQEYLDGWQRSRADFANFKREEAALQDEKQQRIKAELIEEMLPALDALEMSRKHSQAQELGIVEKQFLDVLKRMGVERFGKEGDAFDPHQYEVLQETETADKSEDHTVDEVHRSGYKVGDKIIRPAQVTIQIYG